MEKDFDSLMLAFLVVEAEPSVCSMAVCCVNLCVITNSLSLEMSAKQRYLCCNCIRMSV